LVIGDEILSGRTADTNSNTIAKFLARLGIDLKEIRVVGDVQEAIVTALNVLRQAYDVVFTPVASVPPMTTLRPMRFAKAFDVGIGYHPEAYALLQARYPPDQFNEMRKRMARVPAGASLVANPVSAAPGFHIGTSMSWRGCPW